MKKRLSIWAASALYICTGVAHFVRPEAFVRIVPVWVPDPKAAVLWSGIAEVSLGLGLLWKRTRYISALGIIGLLIAVFPANVKMANDWIRSEHPAACITIARLPLQALLILWAWKVRKA